MYLNIIRPPASSAHIDRRAIPMGFLPSAISSICVYGHAEASSHIIDHQIVRRNKYSAYIHTPQLSETENNKMRNVSITKGQYDIDRNITENRLTYDKFKTRSTKFCCSYKF